MGEKKQKNIGSLGCVFPYNIIGGFLLLVALAYSFEKIFNLDEESAFSVALLIVVLIVVIIIIYYEKNE